MATKKPIKKGSPPEPENPRAESGSFVYHGKACFDDGGVMLINEDGDIPEDIEEDLYLAPDGTMTTYREGDEDDPNSEWYKNPPKEVAAFMSEEELAEIAALPDLP